MYDKNMKKLLTLIVLLCAFSFANAEDTFISLLSGNAEGTYYQIGKAIAKTVSDQSKLHVTLRKSPGSYNNINSIAKKESEIAFVQNDIAHWAYTGTSIFSMSSRPNIRSIAMLYPEHIQILAKETSSLKSVMDLKGKKVGVGSFGSGVEADARAFFSALGIKYSDMQTSFTNFSQTARRVRGGSLDAGLIVAGYPTPVIADLAKIESIRLVPFTNDEIEMIRNKHPFFEASQIPAGVYGLKENTKTIAVRAMLITNEDVSEDVVYLFTKTLFEHLDQIKDSHELAQTITLENAPIGLSVPLHEGAKRYYREAGVLCE